jgi:hypothetical protein
LKSKKTNTSVTIRYQEGRLQCPSQSTFSTNNQWVSGEEPQFAVITVISYPVPHNKSKTDSKAACAESTDAVQNNAALNEQPPPQYESLYCSSQSSCIDFE